MASQQNQSELEEKQALEEQSRAANEVLFKKKKQLTQLQREEQEDHKRYEELQQNFERVQADSQQLNALLARIQEDVQAQGEKMERANQALEVSVRRATNAGVEMAEDSAASLDIMTRALRDENQSVIHALANALQDHSEDVLPLFESLCAEKGITKPSRPPSGASSRPGSGRSNSALALRTRGPS